MQTVNNTVLITGGTAARGLALARAFARSGNEVILCDRTHKKLEEARRLIPTVHTRACDLADEADRRGLVAWVTRHFPGLNVLVNNAGIRLDLDLRHAEGLAAAAAHELTADLQAPLQLTLLLLPHLLRQSRAAVVNVTSELAYVPLSEHPVHSAANAALHSFTLSLRHQLRDTKLEVFEVLLPATDAPLQHKEARQVSPERMALAVLAGMRKRRPEIRVGQPTALYLLARMMPGLTFALLNGGFQRLFSVR
jgi:uncharacterized oxidoreductase